MRKNLFKSTLIRINFFYYRYSGISQVYLGNLDISLFLSLRKKKNFFLVNDCLKGAFSVGSFRVLRVQRKSECPFVFGQ